MAVFMELGKHVADMDQDCYVRLTALQKISGDDREPRTYARTVSGKAAMKRLEAELGLRQEELFRIGKGGAKYAHLRVVELLVNWWGKSDKVKPGFVSYCRQRIADLLAARSGDPEAKSRASAQTAAFQESQKKLHNWHGIGFHTASGYFYADEMCRPYGRRLDDFLATQEGRAVLEQTSKRSNRPVADLVRLAPDGVNRLVHGVVGVALAHWLDVEFFVYCQDWLIRHGLNVLSPRNGAPVYDELHGRIDALEEQAWQAAQEFARLRRDLDIAAACIEYCDARLRRS